MKGVAARRRRASEEPAGERLGRGSDGRSRRERVTDDLLMRY
jgi:hypothetical protein